jgi:spore germination cell wall hydrolase CwlJ-like protein
METTLRGLYLLLGAILVSFITNNIVQHKLAYYKEQSKEYHTISAKVVEQRLNCMAQNIYREAGHEPFEGKVAVAQVTLNRVDDPRFPKDVCAVVYQKNVIMQKVVCQFSWFCDSTYKNKPINKDAYNESMEVAKKVMLEGFRLDGVKHALYYHADYINPNWKLRRVAKIGSHIFYEDKGKD